MGGFDSLTPSPSPAGGEGSEWRYDPRAKLVVYLLGCGVILLTTRPLALLPLTAAPLRRTIRWAWALIRTVYSSFVLSL